MAKINLDKYYTPKEIAWKCILKTVDVIGTGKMIEAIEPSAGNGAFSNLIERCIAYDIEPENDNIIKQDFLQLELPYKKGRIFIGNPPFGSKNTLAVQFYKKCVKMGDYIAFILPINCLNNTNQMYEFDLIHSEDLGKINYSGVEVHCCFNIYKRPEQGLNKKQNTKLKTVRIVEYRRGGTEKHIEGYDYRICAWGASIGIECKEPKQYAQEFCFFIADEFKDRVINVLKTANWKELYKMTATPSLYQWQITKHLRNEIPEIF